MDLATIWFFEKNAKECLNAANKLVSKGWVRFNHSSIQEPLHPWARLLLASPSSAQGVIIAPQKYATTILWLFGEAVHGMRKVRCPYSQSCNMGIAAENDGGQQVRVHDMRKLWCPYYQSCILGGRANKKVGSWDHIHLAQSLLNTSSESLFSLP